MSDDLATFLQHVVNGLSTSSIYILLGVGLTLIFGLSRLINFAHGQFLILGSFLTWQLTEEGFGFAPALIVAVIGVGLLGVVSDRAIFRRTIDRPMTGFVASLGVAIALQAAMVEIWTADIRQIPSPVTGVWEFEGVNLPEDRLLVVGVVITVILLTFLVLDRTGFGRGLKAAAENPDAAQLMGVNVGAAISVSFFVGSALAAVGGALIGAIFPFTPFSGAPFIIKGFAVALVGGLGNVRGAAVAGLLLGMAEALGSAYGIDLGLFTIGPQWRDGFAFVLMIGLLAWRPQGLFGAKARF